MIVTIQGALTKALEKKTGVGKTGTPWASQEFVVTENEKTEVAFEIFGEDNINNFLATARMGAQVQVQCTLQSREWNGRYFTSLRMLQQQQVAPQPQVVQPQMQAPQQVYQQPMQAQPQPVVTQYYNQPQPQQQTSNEALPF